MPSRNEVFQEINDIRNNAGFSQDVIRRKYLKELSEYTKRDTIILASSFSSKSLPNLPSDFLIINNQDIHGFMSALFGLKNSKLDIILHSPGGSAEAAEQIVKYLRKKYDDIRAVIPQNAMSAATMIACACNKIVMGKHSAIGPIDPQINFNTGTGFFSAPAQSILDEFEQAKEEIKKDPSIAAIWVRRIDKYPIGFLKICENSIDLAKKMVEEWLSSWMLKGINNNKEIASDIAEWLSDTNFHKTHGRPIDIIDARDKGLIVESLEDDSILQEKVLSVFHSIAATFEFTNCTKFIENQNGIGTYSTVNIEIKK